MRRHFLALLTGALIVVLSIGVGVSIAGQALRPAGSTSLTVGSATISSGNRR